MSVRNASSRYPRFVKRSGATSLYASAASMYESRMRVILTETLWAAASLLALVVGVGAVYITAILVFL